MYKCRNCGAVFSCPKIEKTTQASIFGVVSINDPIIELKHCPYCDSDEYDALESEEVE